MLNEKDIFDERQETKPANFSCPFCRERHDYDVRWMKRTKKRQAPRHLNQNDLARFNNSRDYMVRIDDMLMCKNMRCRRRFDIPSSQTVVFI
jgi:ribosomal protein S30